MGRRTKWLIVLGIIIILIGTALIFGLRSDTEPEMPPKPPQRTKPVKKADQKPTFAFINLQPILDDWAKRQSGRASVVIYDLENKKVAGQLNPERTFFTASIYKLYVAYIGYQKIEDDTYTANEPYLRGKTRLQCLDDMIRTSDSPCAEAMWQELGMDNLTRALSNKYGLNNTDMRNLNTSAADAALILENIWQGNDLSRSHRKLLLDSMKQQIHRLALPSAFPEGVDVYTKVGFSEHKHYHDTAIVTFPAKNSDGQPASRAYIVSIMTKDVGTANIRDLARELTKAISS